MGCALIRIACVCSGNPATDDLPFDGIVAAAADAVYGADDCAEPQQHKYDGRAAAWTFTTVKVFHHALPITGARLFCNRYARSGTGARGASKTVSAAILRPFIERKPGEPANEQNEIINSVHALTILFNQAG